MAIEIERKFLLKNDSWQSLVTQTHVIKQGYLQSGLVTSQKSSVRIRLSNQQANINIKSVDLAMVRQEYEYTIPVSDAKEMLATMCEPGVIEKTRYHVPYVTKTADNEITHLWEIDIFEKDNAGLIMAEIELSHVNEVFDLPDWIGKEVTEDERYYNIYLLNKPYIYW